MDIIRGKIHTAQKIVIYGPEGIGKSTFAAQFPNTLFIDTEGSTKHMDVSRFPKPTSWQMLLEEAQQVKACPSICGTLVLDTADWAEQLCTEAVCSKAKKSGIEDFGYGKGYIYLVEEFGRLLNLLEDIVDAGVNIVITAHAKMRKFEQPDEMGAYDRWEMKLSKNVAPLVKEWADMILFANYKTYAVSTDDQGKKFKAQGGSRIMYTTHHPCWDAKNRHELKEELPFSYDEIASCIMGDTRYQVENILPPQKSPAGKPKKLEETTTEGGPVLEQSLSPPPTTAPTTLPPDSPNIIGGVTFPPAIPDGIPQALADLMRTEEVSEFEIQVVVSEKGYYPNSMPIIDYDPQFIAGVLVAAWDKVFAMIQENRKDLPF